MLAVAAMNCRTEQNHNLEIAVPCFGTNISDHLYTDV